MSDVLAPERRTAEGVASVYDAALARRAPRTSNLAEPMQTMSADSQETMTALPMVIAPSINGRLAPAADWGATVDLVERAAATIKAYERRFLQLDIHTRALIQRSSEEQARLQEEILSLEAKLRETEERLAAVESVARDEAFYRWEADRRCREAETRAAEAADFSRQSEDYLRRVHSVLADI